ncbi:PAAR domain-containing protein [Pseudovibrio sp. Alg231-02]|uniref:PAAR domain-containing protein n=1 Tax=Pseudovibrio sp. Alg231-02 TaxID=1922223 RepID=UPI000D55DE79|nr:PAAR domain-containing protein [Pseudovibrio sp. Alg231-02]
MPKAARLGDIGSGHGCFPPTPAISGSGDTFINGRKAVRLGDAFAPHGCPQCPPHPRSLSAGSATVFINGKKAGRVGDSIGCGGSVSAGSGDTFIGDVGMGGPLKSCMKGAKDNASPLLDPGLSRLEDPASIELLAFKEALSMPVPELGAFVQDQLTSILESGIQDILSHHVASHLPKVGLDGLTNKALDTLKTKALHSDALIGALKGKVPEVTSQAVSRVSQNFSDAVSSETSLGEPLSATIPNIPDNPLVAGLHDLAQSGNPAKLESVLRPQASDMCVKLMANACGL